MTLCRSLGYVDIYYFCPPCRSCVNQGCSSIRGSNVQEAKLIPDVASSKMPPKTYPFTNKVDPQRPPINAVVSGDLPGEGLAEGAGRGQQGLFPSQVRPWERHFQNPQLLSNPLQEPSKPPSCPCGAGTGGERTHLLLCPNRCVF